MEQIRARGQEWRNSVQQLERFKEQVESLKAKMHEVSRERNGLDLAVAKGLPKALFCFNLKLSQVSNSAHPHNPTLLCQPASYLLCCASLRVS